ncbi:hypothetical protein BH11PAT4_BH11PAT4_2200 [soil metagenome]
MGKKSRQKRQKTNEPKPMQKVVQEQVMPTETALGSRLAQGMNTQTAVMKSDDYSLVRSEIRRIVLYMVVVAAVLASIVIISSRSTFLKNTGGKISTFLQLQ